MHYTVVCAVVRDRDRILCMRKGETKYEYTSYRWEFPGGKVEARESPQEALHRELMEEMEYDVTVGEEICTVTHEYPDFCITMTAFWCTAATHSFVLKEHSEYRWASIDEMRALSWCGADVPIMEAVCCNKSI
ncbi:MAG: (deoxy)nucleoside triphosphate pyrophosphohydrolase [Lachnospiraceae bacterium]|nr:(deoxy)nucleoside triphosphate pyrophosphohydrolase [Lachnospiraceae bacterium]